MRIHLLKFYLDELRKRKEKTALITFAIAWGALSLLLLMSFGKGISNQFSVAFMGLGDDLIIVSRGQTTKVYKGLPRGRQIMLYPQDVELLRKRIPEIKLISPESNTRMTVTYKGKGTNRNVNGVRPSFGIIRSQVADWGGRFLNADDEKYSRRVVFLGWKVASNLFGNEDPIGKKISINRTPFKVIGVMKEKMQSFMYEGPDSEMLYIPFSTFSQIYSQRYVARIHIQPTDRKYSRYVENKIREILGKKYRFDKKDEYAVTVWDTIRQADVTGKVFVGVEIFFGLIGALTLLMGAVGVTNLMYAIVKERTKEIGIKMAVGAKRRHIIRQFLLETSIIFLKGTFWGTLIAFNLIGVVRMIPLDYDDVSIASFLLRPIFSLDILIIFVSILGILIFFSGIFPAIRASRLDVVQALRYE